MKAVEPAFLVEITALSLLRSGDQAVNCSAPLFPPMKMGVLIRPTSGGHCIKSFNTLCFRAMHSKRGFPGGSVVKKKKSACQCRRCAFHPWVGRPQGGGHGNPLQCSCWENPADRGALAGYGLSCCKETQLKRLITHAHTMCCTHSSVLAWRIPQTGEAGRLQPVGSQRV